MSIKTFELDQKIIDDIKAARKQPGGNGIKVVNGQHQLVKGMYDKPVTELMDADLMIAYLEASYIR